MSTPRLTVYYSSRDCDYYKLGLVIAYSLLTSYGIRRSVRVVIDAVCRGVATRLVVDGSRVRHLRMDQDSLEGFVKRGLEGRMRGVRVIRPSGMVFETCLALQPSDEPVAIARLWRVAPPLRKLNAIVLSQGVATCKNVVMLEGFEGMEAWLIVAALFIMLDRWYGGASHERGSKPNRKDTTYT